MDRQTWWKWPFPNRLAAIAVPVVSLLELIALSLSENHLSYTDPPTLASASLLIFASWWFVAWTVSLLSWVTSPLSSYRLGRYLASAIMLLLVFSTLVAWIGSWWLYWTTSRFATFEMVRFLVQTIPHFEALWMPAASQQGLLLASCVLATAATVMFVFVRPKNVQLAVQDALPNRVLRFGCTLLVLYLLSAGTNAWRSTGNSTLLRFDRHEAFTSKTSPTATLTFSLIDTFNRGAIPTDGIDTRDLVSVADAESQRKAALEIPGKQYNVILVQIESLRSDCIGAMHQGVEITPEINKLARGGIQFTNAYSQSTHSNYADPCIASSQYPLRGLQTRIYQSSDPFPKTLIYDTLKPRGYSTAIISSQNESWFGMDQFYKSPNLDLMFDPQRAEGDVYIDERDWWMATEVLSGRLKGGSFVDSFTTDRAIDWIKEQATEQKPFYLQMNLQSSHFPYPLPDGVARPFQPYEMDFPASFVFYPKEKTSVVRNAYWNAIAECDRQVGRIADSLAKLGILDKTIFIVVGENGESFYEDGFVTHAGPPSQVQLRVAWVMTVPGTTEPKIEDYPVELVDVVPTALGILGLPADANHQGIDALAADRPEMPNRFLFFHVNTPSNSSVATIWGGRWKYILSQQGSRSDIDNPAGVAEALYDLENDPAETKNLINIRPRVRAALYNVVQRWRLRQLAYYAYPQFHLNYAPPKPPTASGR